MSFAQALPKAVLGLFGRKRHERAGFALYNQAVRAARDPYFYTELGVPDTMDGRFDMVGLHVCLLIDRLQKEPPPGPALAQAVFDAMFSDMDHTLRELGVGDMSVGRKVKAMWEALHGRAQAYVAALEADDQAAMAAALARNVWRGEPIGDGPDRLASITLARRRELLAQDLLALEAGHFEFAPIPLPNKQ